MNGEGKLINLQTHNASPNKLINEVEVLCNIVYNKKLLKTIESNYGKAPCFSDAFPIIKNIITQEEKNLAKYLEFLIRLVSIFSKYTLSPERPRDFGNFLVIIEIFFFFN